jgi:hypothetical protein
MPKSIKTTGKENICNTIKSLKGYSLQILLAVTDRSISSKFMQNSGNSQDQHYCCTSITAFQYKQNKSPSTAKQLNFKLQTVL